MIFLTSLANANFLQDWGEFVKGGNVITFQLFQRSFYDFAMCCLLVWLRHRRKPVVLLCHVSAGIIKAHKGQERTDERQRG